MSCTGAQIRARRNADLRIGYKPAQKGIDISDMGPLFSIYKDGASVFSVTQSATANGSVFEVIDKSLVLTIVDDDISDLPSGELIYDLTFTDPSGFTSWIMGGRFIILSEPDSSSCVVGDEPIYVQIGDECVQIFVEGSTIGVISDAPENGKYYARQDGDWVEFTPPNADGGSGIPDAPSDGEVYGRSDAEWVDLDLDRFIEDAPSDGEKYVREDGAWESLDLSPYLTDAPSDGKQYAREDGAWSEVVGSGGFGEAPTSAKFDVTYGTSAAHVFTDKSLRISGQAQSAGLQCRATSATGMSAFAVELDGFAGVDFNSFGIAARASNGRFLYLNVVHSTRQAIGFESWSAQATYNASVATFPAIQGARYLALEFIGGATTAYASMTGENWFIIGTSTYLADISHFGFCTVRNNTGNAPVAWYTGWKDSL